MLSASLVISLGVAYREFQTRIPNGDRVRGAPGVGHVKLLAPGSGTRSAGLKEAASSGPGPVCVDQT